MKKWPRYWAAEILAMRTEEQRQNHLKKAPLEWQALIRSHVTIAINKNSASKEKGAAQWNTK